MFELKLVRAPALFFIEAHLKYTFLMLMAAFERVNCLVALGLPLIKSHEIKICLIAIINGAAHSLRFRAKYFA